MAIYLKAKAPASVVRYEWPAPLRNGDSLSTFVATLTSGTAVVDSYETDGDKGVVTVSGGAVGVVQELSFTATTSDGNTIVETAYLPILSSENALGNTGGDIAAYILRKVAGIGDNATADEQSDCLERLSDMLATWKAQGADIGIPLPVTAATEFVCDDAFIQAIKANGILAIADLYENYNPSPVVVEQARRGLQTIKSRLLSTDDRTAVYY